MKIRESDRIFSLMRESFERRPFVPHPWLWTGHLQTVAASQQRRKFSWGWTQCSEDLVKLGNGSEVGIRFVVRDRQAPTLIAIHGMSGSSDSGYMLALSHKAYRAGWNFILPTLYNLETRPSRPRIFHAGCSNSVAEIIRLCSLQHGLEKILLVGISMGGNIVLKLLGESGHKSPSSIKAAGVISPLIDLEMSWPLMDKPANLLYRRYYLRRLRQLSMSRGELMGRFIDLERLRRVKTIREFDDVVTAPLAGFEDALHYYREMSSRNLLPKIRVPTLLIHAKDDPLLPWRPLTAPQVVANDSLLVHLTEAGGHVAFIAKRAQGDIDRSWAENRVIEFFRLALKER